MVSHHNMVLPQMMSPQNGDTQDDPPPPPPPRGDATEKLFNCIVPIISKEQPHHSTKLSF